MQTSEVLNKAADLIEERGWSPGTGWFGTDTTLCIEGGIAAAMGVEGGPGYRCPAYSAVCSYLGREEMALWVWNDTRSTAAEVIEVLRATALIEAARENAETRQAVSVA